MEFVRQSSGVRLGLLPFKMGILFIRKVRVIKHRVPFTATTKNFLHLLRIEVENQTMAFHSNCRHTSLALAFVIPSIQRRKMLRLCRVHTSRALL